MVVLLLPDGRTGSFIKEKKFWLIIFVSILDHPRSKILFFFFPNV